VLRGSAEAGQLRVDLSCISRRLTEPSSLSPSSDCSVPVRYTIPKFIVVTTVDEVQFVAADSFKKCPLRALGKVFTVMTSLLWGGDSLPVEVAGG
jgi:hypothetical protein